MDRDKVFCAADKVLVIFSLDEKGDIVCVNPQDHYRLRLELFLMVMFALALIILGGWTGTKTLLSFVFTGLMLWKVLVPALLNGYKPVFLSLALTTALPVPSSSLLPVSQERG